MYNNVLYRIVDKFYNLFTQYGFSKFVYGTDKDIDQVKVSPTYPTSLLIYTGGSHDAKVTNFNFTIVVGDKIDKTGNIYNEYSKNNILDIQNDLLIKTQTILHDFEEQFLQTYDSIEIGYIINYDVNFDVFFEDLPDLVSGYIFTLSVTVPNVAETC